MITLIWPPQSELHDPVGYPPQGILYLATYLFDRDVPVQIVNLAGFSGTDDELMQIIPKSEWYGISMTTPLYASGQRIVDLIKRTSPESKIVLGGVHPTILPEQTLKELNPDYIVTGDGEKGLHKLITKGSDTRIINGGHIELDELSIPHRTLLGYNWVSTSALHGAEGKRSTTIITSRGCPFSCAYCCKYDGRKIRYRSPESIYTELKMLKEKYHIEHIRFVDDVFTMNKDRLEKLCELIAPLGITWLSITRADLVNRDILQIMKDAGNIELCFGVESGSNEQLKRMRKVEKREEIENAIHLTKEMGISTKVFLLFGFPGETRETVEATKAFMQRAKPDKYTMSTFVPLPGSDVFNNPDKYNVEIIARDWKDYWFYWDYGDRRGYFIKYPNEEEIYSLRDELKLFLAEGSWKND